MKKKILVVDDEEGILDFIKTALEITGYSVETALSASEALEKVVEETPDVLLSDVRMPGGGSGVDLMFLTEFMERNVAIILMSGAPSSKAQLPPGAKIRFLEKPFTIDELRDSVAEVLHHQ